MSDNNPFLHIDSLNISLGKFSLDDISLKCQKGEYHILMGPSGSGKSTLMKCVLGFNRVKSGSIYLGGRNITDQQPERRRMGYVPQNYALFPHLNVEENIRFGLRAQKVSASEADSVLKKLIGVLRIEKLRNRSIENLSGGERQKVAIGRALGAQPEVILLDEPFSSIDESGKRGLWFELKQIFSEIDTTVIHITHNLEEAYTLGERLSVLIDGHLVQTGLKEEIFEHPVNEDIARYLNYKNIFKGRSQSHREGTLIEMQHFGVIVGQKLPLNKETQLCIRAQDVKIVKEDVPVKDSLKRNIFKGEIVKIFSLSEYCLMWFKIDGSVQEFDFEVRFPLHIKARHNLYSGKTISVALWEPKIIVLNERREYGNTDQN